METHFLYKYLLEYIAEEKEKNRIENFESNYYSWQEIKCHKY